MKGSTILIIIISVDHVYVRKIACVHALVASKCAGLPSDEVPKLKKIYILPALTDHVARP